MKSLKELFRIGHGPSSSHTMGPFRAAELFLERHPKAATFEVTLFGSMAATGRGHFTDTAITTVFGENRTRIIWVPERCLPAHPNGMLFTALDEKGGILDKWQIFSIGGGAISEDGRQENTPELYPYASMEEMLSLCDEHGNHLWHLVENAEGTDWLAECIAVMFNTLKTGLTSEGVLPGGLRLVRKAREVFLKARNQRKEIRRTGLLSAYAYAVAEENASLGTIVTAPTCGSCGVLPAVLYHLKQSYRCTDVELRRALAVAGLVGNVVKQNGSISGAEVGCQGEVGTACAMASAAATYLLGGTPRQCEYAAEIGLEHFLGLTCDPVLGLVQIPCIERNAVAANRAMIAAELALLSDGHHIVSFDNVVQAMLKTGRDLPSLYRETAQGGLASIIG